MLASFLLFIGGAVLMKTLQYILDVKPNYHVWKHTEYTVLQILADLHVQQLTANQIIKLAYEEAGKEEELAKVKSVIEQKYNTLINTCIQNMKNNLPYKVEYNTIKEAVEIYLKNLQESRDGSKR